MLVRKSQMFGNKIGIVGGGPGGLMTAYLLQKMADRTVEITLFDATDRLGGKILTPAFTKRAARYEAGAAEFYDYTPVDEDPLKELVTELGLSINPMGGSSVIINNRVIANLDDIQDQLGLPARRALEEFDDRARGTMSPRVFYESDLTDNSRPTDTNLRFNNELQSIAEDSARRFVECLIHSDLATEPEQTSVSYGLQNYLMNHPAYMKLYSIEGGNQQLPEELARRTRMQNRMLHTVTEICKTEDSRLRITALHDGILQSEDFDIVVVALPNDALPSVNYSDTRLSEAMTQHHLQYNHPAHYLRMTLLFDEPFWRGQMLDSYCMLENFHGCCLYDESSREPESKHGVMGWLLAGRDAEELSELSDTELIEKALDSLPEFCGDGRQHFLEGRVHRWIGAVNALPGGIVPQPPDRRHQPEPVDHFHLFVVGDYLFDSTLNGVLDSATYVSNWIASLFAEDDKALPNLL